MTEMKRKPILLFDFDGVIHSYKSGWKGAAIIPDEPVPGAIELLTKLLLDGIYQPCIYSARSCQWGGKRSMKRYLREQFYKIADMPWEDIRHSPVSEFVFRHWHMEPYPHDIIGASRQFVKMLKFPTKKPPAILTIDDRCICFDGDMYSLMGKISNFKAWHGKGL